MNVTIQMILTVCPLVFLAAMVDAIGGGGGLISLPAYLIAGLDPVTASGTNKLSASAGTLIATIKYMKSGKVLIKPSVCAVAGALPGAFLGAEILKRTPEQIVRIFLLVAIPAIALVLIFKRDMPVTSRPLTAKALFLCFGIGLLTGIYDGFFGPGTGTLLIMGLTLCAGMDMITASGSAKLINLASNIGALTSMLLSGRVLFALAIPAMACSLIGGYAGSAIAIKRGARIIRLVMLGVLLLLMIKLGIDFLQGISRPS